MDDYRRHFIKKLSGSQSYCDACDYLWRRGNRKCSTCGSKLIKRSVRQRLKRELLALLRIGD